MMGLMASIAGSFKFVCFLLFHCNRFISDEEVLNRIRSTFTGLYTLDEVRIILKYNLRLHVDLYLVS